MSRQPETHDAETIEIPAMAYHQAVSDHVWAKAWIEAWAVIAPLVNEESCIRVSVHGIPDQWERVGAGVMMDSKGVKWKTVLVAGKNSYANGSLEIVLFPKEPTDGT